MGDQRYIAGVVPALGMAVDPVSAPARASQRDSLLLTATLRAESVEAPLRVRNLSAGGLMADYTGMLHAGAAVEVELRGIGFVPARVAWVRKGRIGLTFAAEINPRLARTAPARLGLSTFEPARPMHDGRSRRPGLRSQ